MAVQFLGHPHHAFLVDNMNSAYIIHTDLGQLAAAGTKNGTTSNSAGLMVAQTVVALGALTPGHSWDVAGIYRHPHNQLGPWVLTV